MRPASNCSAASAADSPGTDCTFSPKPSTTRRVLAAAPAPVASYAQNWLDLSAERSLSSFNRTHTFNLNVQYSTGQGTSGGTLLSGWKGALAKDWTFAITMVAGSGLPETPILLQRVATGTGVTGTVRADYIGGSLDSHPPGYGFNIDAFAKPLSGQWGDAGRNIITGPVAIQFECIRGPGVPHRRAAQL